jgi:putative DNA primase/helicase
MELRAPTPDDHLLIKIPHNYNPAAVCPKFMDFIGNLFEPTYMPVLQEYVGYCMIPTTKFQKALMLHGPGGNGKSVFVMAIRNMLNPKNTSDLSLAKICGPESRFAIIDLRGKLLNASTENPQNLRAEIDTLKALITGDPLYAEAKGVQGFSFKPYAKHIFAVNSLPRFNDYTHANIRRWLVVKTLKTFKGKTTNRELDLQVTTEDETEGIIIWAVEGLKRLIAQNDFTDSEAIENNVKEMIVESDSVACFIQDCCTVTPGISVPVSKLMDAYTKYCKDRGLKPVYVNSMLGRMRDVNPEIDSDRDTKGVRCYMGIDINYGNY